MKTYMIIYIDNFKVYQCVTVAENESLAEEKAANAGIKNIVSVQDLHSYFIG